MPKTSSFDAIIIGAGAAGMFCAALAGQRGRRILLVDHSPEPGRKILISGGGRCNFTNIGATASNFLSANPHFAKSALSRFTPADFIALVDRHGIAWHEKTLGQLFCDGSSKQIVAMLLDECAAGKVETAFGQAATVEHRNGSFQVSLGKDVTQAPALVLASGGLSIPKLGATSFAYDVARSFGLKIVEPRPALVPLTLSGEEALFKTLSGVSAEVVARAGNGSFREAALFTHRGLSGPAILQVSSYWRHGDPVTIDFLPDLRPGWLRQAKRDDPRITLRRLLGRTLPDRLAETLSDQLGIGLELGNIPDRALDAAEHRLAEWQFAPNGSEGFAKAEVTIGGISTAELSSQTMESKRVPGLLAIGEAVDVTGWLGGYNFQWAWASAHAAAQSL
ncbi:aminoacetone oxidase family FAD-binding enzyme [Sphingomonas sediminicola]|uniref:Aminoacetone oxidase family FAD-binding enzyme n=1 Tax=Sphingomonas sediminicola TaxID=386874 RepID=A0ABX6TA61_9SPHN|nr:aminoacetone oxidase family FAD-binding enzyme [Sphingomonas sediminicola]QNP46276.1 aminoacetone oxidase family FAD-binding enzyme [Sphingomonas sediminicola]